jgi:geranylgeranyl diphosphate synthase type I
MTFKQNIKDSLVENATKIDTFIDQSLREGSPRILYDAGLHIIEAGGKRLRPYLTLKSCEAVGGDPEIAIPFAAALEILHSFTLIHDDVMDNDSMRRGRPTVHTKFGEPMAILAGDLLFAKVFNIMTNSIQSGVEPNRILSAIATTAEATITICEGQALDIGFPDASSVEEEDYFTMVGSKTSALFRACAMVGATIGGASEKHAAALGDFAWDSGIAFQIIDDVLGITANEEKLGKPVGSDIREGKKTLIIIHALVNASSEERKVLMDTLGNEDASHEALNKAVITLKNLGSIDYARKMAMRYRDKALKTLETLPDSQARAELSDMLEYFVQREY